MAWIMLLALVWFEIAVSTAAAAAAAVLEGSNDAQQYMKWSFALGNQI